MPSKSIKQQRFFQAVKGAKYNPGAPENLRKVANSMSEKDIDDFIKCESEFKVKKAILSVLKDIREPMYLEESDESDKSIEPVSDQWPEKKDWATYIKPFVGQPISEMELNALNTFKENDGKEPVSKKRTEIWYKGVDKMGKSKTTVIKKMKDSGQFSYLSCQLIEEPEPQDSNNQGMDSGGFGDMGGLPPLQEVDGMPPTDNAGIAPSSETPDQQKEKDVEAEKENILVTKSILFKDDIKGAAILVSFLKKLDL